MMEDTEEKMDTNNKLIFYFVVLATIAFHVKPMKQMQLKLRERDAEKEKGGRTGGVMTV